MAKNRDRMNRPRGGLTGPRAVLLVLGCAAATHGQCTPVWSGLNGGADSDARAAAAGDRDGQGPAPMSVFLAGTHTIAGGVAANRIVDWDGWSARAVGAFPNVFGSTIDEVHGWASTLRGAVPAGIYVGGSFHTTGTTKARNLTRWLQPQWNDVGGGVVYVTTVGLGGVVHAAEMDSGTPSPTLVVGGTFNRAGNVPVTSLARWDGSAWSAIGGPLVGSGNNPPGVYALTYFDDDGPGPILPALYVGGNFISAGGTPARHIARWDGTAWQPLWVDSAVDSLCVFDEDGPGPGEPALFVGGQFIWAGYPQLLPTGGLARWDGQQWSAVGAWQHGGPLAMAVFDDDGPGPRKPALFAGGYWTSIPGNTAANHLARWDGQQWTALGTGVNGSSVDGMAVFDEDGAGPNPGGLYIAGRFWSAGSVNTAYLARWGCPLPPRCDANCNKDFHTVTGQHVLTIADFGCFQTRFVLQDPAADCNEDGQLTIADFGCFQTKFAVGCP